MPPRPAQTLPTEATEAVKLLSDSLDRLTDKLAQRAAKAPVPPTLFHYTSPAGLKGIVESGRLRLSNIFKLNDPSEIHHGVQYALAALQRAAANGHKGARLFAWKFSEHLGGRIEDISQPFIACFSPNSDDFGQWRTYAANGKGFALGFEGPKLEAAFARTPHLSASFAMIYDDQLLRQIVESIASEALRTATFPAGKQYDGPTLSAFLQAISVQIGNAILYTAMYFKHPAYAFEHEYRFEHVKAIDNLEGVLTEGARSYIEFDWRSSDPTLLTHIVLGPSVEREQAVTYATECLRSAGLDPRNVYIDASSIPYRG